MIGRSDGTARGDDQQGSRKGQKTEEASAPEAFLISRRAQRGGLRFSAGRNPASSPHSPMRHSYERQGTNRGSRHQALCIMCPRRVPPGEAREHAARLF